MTINRGIAADISTHPIVIFNKSHSGSRLLSNLLKEAGVYLGANLNESFDSLDLLELVRTLVIRYYPDYSPLWQPEYRDDGLDNLIRKVFQDHLAGWDKNSPWGWKLCETTYILPVVDALFPDARYIHLIRDGRDVAFSNHRAPHELFWKKIYFNTGEIQHWRGLPMTKSAYRKRSHIYNVLHWQNSVTVGCNYGAMLRDRYLEVKYEDLCFDFTSQAKRIFHFLDLEVREDVLDRVSSTVSTASIGKYRQQPNQKIREVLFVAKPLLMSLGYIRGDTRRLPFNLGTYQLIRKMKNENQG